MKLVARRGVNNVSNAIHGIQMAQRMTDMVEIAVKYNANRDVIIITGQESSTNENTLLIDLLESSRNKVFLHLIVDIKVFGISQDSRWIAYDVVNIISKYKHIYKFQLCSFNEYCVAELIQLRNDNHHMDFKIGVISSGIPIGMFRHILELDFVSLDYKIVSNDVIKSFQERGIKVYCWTVNDRDSQNTLMKYNADAIIFDIVLRKNTTTQSQY